MSNPISDPLVRDVISEDVAAAPVTLAVTPEGIATVTLRRPERRNAFDGPMVAALTEIFETLRADEQVRLVLLRGEGGVFCAGGDLDWMRAAADWSEDDNRDDALAMGHMLKALFDLPALTVALVEGAALGGGAGLAAACDLALATADARLGFPEVRVGLIPAVISPYVVRAIGPRAAGALFALGQPVDASRALALGLVSEVVADAAGLEAAAAALSKDILACAPGAVGEAKRVAHDVAGHALDQGLIHDTAKRLAAARVSDEGREGLAAFLDKRPPAWAVKGETA